jgi:hypothetical protein
MVGKKRWFSIQVSCPECGSTFTCTWAEGSSARSRCWEYGAPWILFAEQDQHPAAVSAKVRSHKVPWVLAAIGALSGSELGPAMSLPGRRVNGGA